MKALVYHGPGKKQWEDVPDATIQDPTDVIVRVDTTTICGTDQMGCDRKGAGQRGDCTQLRPVCQPPAQF